MCGPNSDYRDDETTVVGQTDIIVGGIAGLPAPQPGITAEGMLDRVDRIMARYGLSSKTKLGVQVMLVAHALKQKIAYAANTAPNEILDTVGGPVKLGRLVSEIITDSLVVNDETGVGVEHEDATSPGENPVDAVLAGGLPAEAIN